MRTLLPVVVVSLVIFSGCASVPLHDAIGRGDMEEFGRLLREGADVNERDGNGYTALMKAADEGNLEMARLLIANGADVRARDDYGGTALSLAAPGNRRIEIARLLVEKGADVNAVDDDGRGTSVLMLSLGHIDMMRLLIDGGAQVNAGNRFGMTALMRAISNGDIASAKFLIENRADVNITDGYLNTAVHYAINNKSRQAAGALRLLCESGARFPAQPYLAIADSGLIVKVDNRPVIEPDFAYMTYRFKGYPFILNEDLKARVLSPGRHELDISFEQSKFKFSAPVETISGSPVKGEIDAKEGHVYVVDYEVIEYDEASRKGRWKPTVGVLVCSRAGAAGG